MRSEREKNDKEGIVVTGIKKDESKERNGKGGK